ncbi:MAG: peptide-methionine (R)-S-oxide reductase MsrB [Rhabdaerophilum sp.]
MSPKIQRSNAEWRDILTPEQFFILREHGTERPGTGPHLHEDRPGLYLCAGCENPLFIADTKFDAGCGWPSFFQAIKPDSVREIEDRSFGMRRVEIRCGSCDGHLGHVFPDGPRPTGLRYCMNGHALRFEPIGET